MTNKIKTPPGMKKVKSKTKNLIVINKDSSIILDDYHIMGVGNISIIQKNIIKDFYVPISFSFEYIKQAEMFFKSIHADRFDESKLKVMMPSKKLAPVIFLYNDDHVFCIAPRSEEDSCLLKGKQHA